MIRINNLLIDAAGLPKSFSNGTRFQLIPNVAGLLALNFNFGLTTLLSSSLLSLEELFWSPLAISLTTYIRDVAGRRRCVVHWSGPNRARSAGEVSGRRVELRLYHLLHADQETNENRKNETWQNSWRFLRGISLHKLEWQHVSIRISLSNEIPLGVQNRLAHVRYGFWSTKPALKEWTSLKNNKASLQSLYPT